ncbi:putative lipoprotein [Actinobacillus minor NM305]|uniref:Putative lipoprotein n=1 Tax=Actinobacillus minor NM305 TaxID=637911 RepID=C5S2N4_9PAST|nr:YajG family lipoprotein [Actinobacillus minor]EER46809.1 putative lipoprotein [Actinobacillus minor NM305]MDY5105907.1 YajG family lipoprotein [Actinobacillus minor]
MKFSKKMLFAMATLSAAVLTGCQSGQSNFLTFTTPSPTAVFNTNNQTAAVSVNTQDLRTSREIAAYTKNGEIIRLSSSPEVAQMFQQAVQQDLNAKGFQIVQGAANAHVTVNIKRFFATVEQGNLRHKANAEVNVEVSVQGSKGNFNKSFNATRSYEGVLGADNDSIKDVLSQAYQDVVKAIYNDNEVANAIHQYK